jgi:tungstate transport system ATP-binding protein
MMPETAFRLHDVQKTYGSKTVLRVEALTIQAGEVFALVGPSGAGKSTLLRMLNFLEPPTAGVIEFSGQTATPEREPDLPTRRRVTTVFQRPVLLNRSVEANVTYGLALRGIRLMDSLVSETLSLVGLEEMRRNPARTLSGGEAQRVALARALVIDPQVLLLDEPTANLDPYNVGLIEEIVSRRNREQGTTIVLVTHNVFQAKRMAHRVGLMLNGQLIEVADTERFFHAPTDPRTQAFVNGELIY